MSAELGRDSSASRRPLHRRQPLPDGVTREAPVHLTAEQRDRFRGDLDELVREAESLIRRVGAGQKQPSADLRNGLRATLRQARSSSVAVDPTLASRAGEMGMTLDDYVREEPWIAMALAGGVGVLVGWIVSRR